MISNIHHKVVKCSRIYHHCTYEEWTTWTRFHLYLYTWNLQDGLHEVCIQIIVPPTLPKCRSFICNMDKERSRWLWCHRSWHLIIFYQIRL